MNIPEKVLLAEKADESSFARELRLLAAIKLYELGRLSSGKAAELAGIPRVEFLLELGRYNVFPFEAELRDWRESMSEAISNTSPLLYLHRIGVLNWIPGLFTEVWIPKGWDILLSYINL